MLPAVASILPKATSLLLLLLGFWIEGKENE